MFGKKDRFIDEVLKLVRLKLEGKHPSKKQMIDFSKKFGDRVDARLITRESGGSNFFCNPDGTPTVVRDEAIGYFDFVEILVKSSISSSCVTISCLPWKEVMENLYVTSCYDEDDDGNREFVWSESF